MSQEIQGPKRKIISNQLQPVIFMVFLSLLVAIFVLARSVIAGGNGSYLYKPGPNDRDTLADVFPVVEYVASPKLPSETEEEYKKRKNHPTFLTKDETVDRVVLLYAPWCGHCIHFKPKYIEMAREVNREHLLTFHAISCVEHHDICNDQKIRGYPAIKWFGAGNDEGELMDRYKLNSKYILKNYLHIEGGNDSKGDHVRIGGKKSKTKHSGEEYGGSLLSIFKKNNAFSDASLSWDFAMRTSIFMTNDALKKKQRSTLKSWLDLMVKTMPLELKSVQNSAISLLNSFDEVVESEDNLLKHLGEERKREWTRGCSKGGYTCGLWTLFHIMTIGLTEWNINSHDRVSTEKASRILRDYIEEFFACNECRQNFIRMYDDGEFDRLNRLSEDTSDASMAEWKQLSLWLWEVHNDVNVRLLGESFLEQDRASPTKDEKQKARWPSKTDCPRCWLDGGGWDEDEVYIFLRSYYWPDKQSKDTHSQKPISGMSHLKAFEPIRKVQHAMEEIKSSERRYSDFSRNFTIVLLVFVAALFACYSRRRRLIIRRQKSV